VHDIVNDSIQILEKQLADLGCCSTDQVMASKKKLAEFRHDQRRMGI
jgi:hypothetical protein